MIARVGSTLLGMVLCASAVGCDSGGIAPGTPKEATGNVLPGGFEDMAKRTGGAMSKGGGTAAAPTKESSKETSKETPKETVKKDVPKDASKETPKEQPK